MIPCKAMATPSFQDTNRIVLIVALARLVCRLAEDGITVSPGPRETRLQLVIMPGGCLRRGARLRLSSHIGGSGRACQLSRIV